MELSKSIKKLDKYYGRLKKGKVQKIKPNHVEKVINKLRVKEQIIKDELAETTKTSKAERLNQKLVTVQDQLKRAAWLLLEIEKPRED